MCVCVCVCRRKIKFESLEALGQLENSRYTDTENLNKNIYFVYNYSLFYVIHLKDKYTC